MPVLAPSKYALKSLHEEIALFDRKIAHLEKYESFSTAEERNAAANKMTSKRQQLVKAAKTMTDAGITVDPSSMRTLLVEHADEGIAAPSSSTSDAGALDVTRLQMPTATQGGTPLDFRNSIAEYKKRRGLIA